MGDSTDARVLVRTARISQGETVSGHNTVSSITRSGTTATATTSQSHGYVPDQKVIISGATGTGAGQYNGTFKVISVPSSTTFTYLIQFDPGANASGTLVSDSPIECEGYLLAAIGTPASLTGSALTFQGDIDGSGRYVAIKESDNAGASVSFVMAADSVIMASSSEVILTGLVGMKLVSGSAEAAARLFTVHFVRTNY